MALFVFPFCLYDLNSLLWRQCQKLLCQKLIIKKRTKNNLFISNSFLFENGILIFKHIKIFLANKRGRNKSAQKFY